MKTKNERQNQIRKESNGHASNIKKAAIDSAITNEVILLEIAKCIASAQCPVALLTAVNEKMKSVFGYYDTGLVIVSEDGKFHEDLSPDHCAINGSFANQIITEVFSSNCLRTPHKGSVVELHMRQLEERKTPMIISWDEFYSDNIEAHPFLPVMRNIGIKESLVAPLQTGGQMMGCMYLNAIEEDAFPQEKFCLIQSLADLVAVALSKMRTKEQGEQQENDKTTLVEITQLIAQVTEREELLRLIIDKIRPVFNFYDCGLFILNADGSKHSDLAALPDVDPSEFNHINAPYAFEVEHRRSVIEWMMNEIGRSAGPVLFDFAELIRRYPDYPQFKFAGLDLLKTGYRDCLATNLIVQGKTIGMFCINAVQKDYFPPTVFPLFQSVADTLAIAISNIRANEEIMEREREKTLLLSISEDISKIRDAKGLFEVLYQKVQPLFGSDFSAITVLDGLNKEVRHLLGEGDSSWRQTFEENEVIGTKSEPYQGHFVQYVQSLPDGTVYCIPEFEGVYLGAAIPFCKQIGLVESFLAKLYQGGKLIGDISFHSRQKGRFRKINLPLLQNLANQVAVAVANILANEEILEREREKSVLLSISQSIASSRNSTELLAAIRDKARQLFSFYDTAILIVEPDRRHHYDLAITQAGWEKSDANTFLSEAGLRRLPHEGSHLESIIQLLKETKHPLIVNWREQFARFQDPFFPIVERAGYRESVTALLRTGDQIIGTLWLNALQEDFFQPDQLAIFQSLADQVSVAVSNILAAEEILKREREKSILLSMSRDIASVRDAQELLKVIRSKAQQIIPFYDTGILIVDDARLYHYDLSVVHQAWDDSEGNKVLQEKGFQKIPHQGSYVAFVEELIRTSGRPLIENMEQRIQEFDYPYFPILTQIGYQECMVTTLEAGGRLLGTLWLSSLKKKHFNSNQFDIFQSLADQVSVAVSNIIGREQIIEREREKGLLLSVAEDIATIRDEHQLFKIVAQRLRKILRFDDALITVNVPSKRAFYILTSYVSEQTNNQQDFHSFQKQFHPFELGNYLDVMNQEDVVIELVRDIIDRKKIQASELPDSIVQRNNAMFALLEQTGLKVAMHVNLIHGVTKIGQLRLLAYDPDSFPVEMKPLYQAVANQIAVAVSNVLVNAEVNKREIEKKTLLDLSEAMATIRNRQDLFNIMMSQVKPIIGFEFAAVLMVNADSGNYYQLLTTEYEEIRNHRLYQTLKQTFPLNQFYLKLLNDPGVVVRSGDDLESLYVEQGDLLTIIKDLGIIESCYITLQQAGSALGILVLHASKAGVFIDEKHRIIKGIGDQVGLAVANIVANEAILQREREKETILEALRKEESIKSLQLAINNDLINIVDKGELFLRLAQYLDKVVLIDFFEIKFISDESFGDRLIFEKVDGRFVCVPAKQKSFDKKAEDIYEIQFYRKELTIVTGLLFEELLHKFPHVEAEKARGVRSILFAGLGNGDSKAVIILRSKKAFAYDDEEKAMLERLVPQVTILLDKLVAYGKIESLSEQLKLENTVLIEEIKGNVSFDEIVGEHPSIKDAFYKVRAVAASDTTVLISGETGTGKELIARALHNSSNRRNKAFIKLNCASLPHNLVESELFGHEKGAFTGALERRIGKFELAHGGTLFLDEIAEMPLETQSKLLRAIQEKEIERIGGNKVVKCDVRIIAASHRELSDEVDKKNFRQDLFYRLHVFPIELPPLRNRASDIPLLVTHFIEIFNKKHGKRIKGIDQKVLDQLMTYSWPGNIRELEHVIERAIISCEGMVVKHAFIPEKKPHTLQADSKSHVLKTLHELERDHILDVLRHCNGRIRGAGGAAHLLDLIPTTLESKMKKLGISKQHYLK